MLLSDATHGFDSMVVVCMLDGCFWMTDCSPEKYRSVVFGIDMLGFWAGFVRKDSVFGGHIDDHILSYITDIYKSSATTYSFSIEPPVFLTSPV